MSFKHFVKLGMFVLTSIPACGFAFDCYIGSFDLGIGWRRDQLKWEVSDLADSSVDAIASSHLNFKDVEMYMVHGKARWAGSAYYVRLAADYGWTDKGRAHEHFNISSPLVCGSLGTFVSSPIKRRSEVYDFNLAVGYPFSFRCNCLMVVPLVGYSFHRQRLRVCHKDHSSFSSDFSLSSSNPFFSSSSFDSFTFGNTTISSDSFDPFGSDSASNVAEVIGFSPLKHTDTYRFTWYGPFVGVDLAYGLDETWTLFGEFEFHFLDRCHRKRESYTAVDFIDDYHSKQWAYGFNGSIGTTIYFCSCWYTIIAVDFKFWKSNGGRSNDDSSCQTIFSSSVPGHAHDDLEWKSVGANISLGYIF